MPALLSEIQEEIHFPVTIEQAEDYTLAINDHENLQTETAFINGVNNRNRPVRFDIEATVIGDGIISGEFGHSVYCEMDEFDTIAPHLEKLTTTAKGLFPDFDFKELTKDDGVFFLKLSHKNGKYTANILPNCVPTAPEKSSFESGAKLVITCSINVWVNYKSATAGFFLNCTKIMIDGGKKKPRR